MRTTIALLLRSEIGSKTENYDALTKRTGLRIQTDMGCVVVVPGNLMQEVYRYLVLFVY